MRSKYLLHPFLLLLIFTVLAGCAGPLEQSQLSFGIKAAKSNLWDEAIFRWQKVLKENPESVAAHNNLAVAYEKKGNWEEAKKEYELALDIQPGNKLVYSNYQEFLKRHQDKEGETHEKK
jgi:Tfp pilus assembly protein PilF